MGPSTDKVAVFVVNRVAVGAFIVLQHFNEGSAVARHVLGEPLITNLGPIRVASHSNDFKESGTQSIRVSSSINFSPLRIRKRAALSLGCIS